MQVKSIAPWFGGKRTMAPAIVRELYRGWTFVDHTRLKTLHVQNGDGQTKNAPEVLIINGKSYAGAS